jgi:hypothetical protein
MSGLVPEAPRESRDHGAFASEPVPIGTYAYCEEAHDVAGDGLPQHGCCPG